MAGSTKDNEIFQFLTGTDDNGNAINFNVETRRNNISIYFEHIVNPAEILIDVEAGSNITIMVAYDNGPFETLGKVDAGMSRLAFDIDPKTGDFPRCRELSIAIREMSKQAVRINQLAMSFYDTDEVTNVPENE
jgi:hypothetical protein